MWAQSNAINDVSQLLSKSIKFSNGIDPKYLQSAQGQLNGIDFIEKRKKKNGVDCWTLMKCINLTSFGYYMWYLLIKHGSIEPYLMDIFTFEHTLKSSPNKNIYYN